MFNQFILLRNMAIESDDSASKQFLMMQSEKALAAGTFFKQVSYYNRNDKLLC